MKTIEFYKYQGNGNDFIIIDSRNKSVFNDLIANNNFSIKALCDRNYGIGADGVIFILDSELENDAKMIIYNSDNSEAEMCGNGIRCMIEYLNNSCLSKKSSFEYKIDTKAGLKTAKYNSGQISVSMGKPILENNLIPTTLNEFVNDLPSTKFNYKSFSCQGYAVGMGNPHLIFFVDNLEKTPHEEYGPIFERNILFPEKTNVHFCQIIDNKNIKVKVWERGVGSTLACGTGACAIHVAAHKLSKCLSKTSINLPGGKLCIEWNDIDDEVLMTGDAKKVFKGFFNII